MKQENIPLSTFRTYIFTGPLLSINTHQKLGYFFSFRNFLSRNLCSKTIPSLNASSGAEEIVLVKVPCITVTETNLYYLNEKRKFVRWILEYFMESEDNEASWRTSTTSFCLTFLLPFVQIYNCSLSLELHSLLLFSQGEKGHPSALKNICGHLTSLGFHMSLGIQNFRDSIPCAQNWLA